MPHKYRGFSHSIYLFVYEGWGGPLTEKSCRGLMSAGHSSISHGQCPKFRLLYLSQEQEVPLLCHLVRFCSSPRVQLKPKSFPTWPDQDTPLSSGLGGTLATTPHRPQGTPPPHNSDVLCPTAVPDHVWASADLNAACTCLKTASRGGEVGQKSSPHYTCQAMVPGLWQNLLAWRKPFSFSKSSAFNGPNHALAGSAQRCVNYRAQRHWEPLAALLWCCGYDPWSWRQLRHCFSVTLSTVQLFCRPHREPHREAAAVHVTLRHMWHSSAQHIVFSRQVTRSTKSRARSSHLEQKPLPPGCPLLSTPISWPQPTPPPTPNLQTLSITAWSTSFSSQDAPLPHMPHPHLN